MGDARALTSYDWEPFDNAALILADLDGCLISGATVLPGVREFFRRYSDKLAVVSNNSEDTCATLRRRLVGLDLDLPDGHAFLAGEQAVRQLAGHYIGEPVLLYGSEAIKDLARAFDVKLCRPDQKPSLILLARDVTFNFDGMAAVMAHVSSGVPVWITNPDPSHPRADGLPVPETGALWAGIEAATKIPPARVVGKPQPLLLNLALHDFGVAAEDAVMVGDTAATDGAAANAAGVVFVHVDQRDAN